MQAVARRAGFSVAHIVRQNEVILARVQQLPWPKQHTGEYRTQKLVSRASRAMKDQNGIGCAPAGVLHRCAERGVVHPQLRDGFARLKAKIVDDKVTLVSRWPAGGTLGRILDRIFCGLLRSGLSWKQGHCQSHQRSQVLYDPYP